MSRLAVIFPGIGYTADKPLLYYSRKLSERAGYEIRTIPFHGFPKKAKGDAEKLRVSCELACKQAADHLKDTDLGSYDDVLFIGKSIGTVAAANIAAHSSPAAHIRLILFTPLEETFSYSFSDAVVFTGSSDPWTGGRKSRIAELCAQRGIPCFVIPDANHSLETANALTDLNNLQHMMTQTDSFIREEQIRRIAYYEQLLDELTTAVSFPEVGENKLSAFRETADALGKYYGSDDWRMDFADDEAGRLPSGLKRGVLSEDGIYNALENYTERTGYRPNQER